MTQGPQQGRGGRTGEQRCWAAKRRRRAREAAASKAAAAAAPLVARFRRAAGVVTTKVPSASRTSTLPSATHGPFDRGGDRRGRERRTGGGGGTGQKDADASWVALAARMLAADVEVEGAVEEHQGEVEDQKWE